MGIGEKKKMGKKEPFFFKLEKEKNGGETQK